MMRPETEVPSDFQDYTLVTVVSVAAHLSGHELGDKVRVLYVFWHTSTDIYKTSALP